MALELRQQLKLSQQLVMTPQLQQAIRLLQLSRLELLETIQQELLENPVLEERLEAPAEQSADDRESHPSSDDATDGYATEISNNADWEDYMGEFASTARQSSRQEAEYATDEDSGFEARFSTKPSLEGHLIWQLRLSSLPDEWLLIGEAIIGELSSTGYLHTELEDIAAQCAVSVATVEAVLQVIQNFDPVGVAARTAQECLLIQLKALRYDRDPILVALVSDHLEDLEARQYKKILRKLKLSQEDLKEYMDILQGLEPMPGASYGGDEPAYVSPDAYVYRQGDDFVIVLNEDGMPQLQVSPVYEEMAVVTDGSDSASKDYLQDKMRAATWLIKSLHQRQRTLYKVVESIVKFQRAFFEEGAHTLRPLILKEIADDIEMHESTVSRITSNKYVATPYGIFELKYFFNSALALDDGNEVGSESVKVAIKKLISDEDSSAPLSDERIGELLNDTLGVQIARRTVAKYRMAMDIESSSRRKQFF